MALSDANKICVLYVDDEDHNLKAFKANFRKSFLIYTAISIQEGKTILDKKEVHVLVIDHRMLIKLYNEESVEITHKYNKHKSILLTTFADIAYLENAVKKGKIYTYFQKPWDDVKLKTAIEDAYVFYNNNE